MRCPDVRRNVKHGSWRAAGLVLMTFGGLTCASSSSSERMPATAILSQPPADVAAGRSPPGPPTPAPTSPSAPVTVVSTAPVRIASNTPASALDQQAVARARTLVDEATKHYRAGSYDKAESALKEAIALYPFLADANLLLGKVFLLKGSALRDVGMVSSARLMFEMAHNIDPTLREAELLLDLFTHEPSEKP